MGGLVTCLIVLFAISIAFWRLGSPVGSNLCRSEIALSTSGGFPKQNASYQPSPPPAKSARHEKYSQTRHFTDPLTDSCSHPYDADLAERVLIKPLVDELASVFKGEVKSGGAHVSVCH